MKKSTLVFVLSLCFSSLLMAQDISDVSASDGDYNSIRASIEKGYLSVFSDQSFKPERPVSRREIALILDGILETVDRKKLSLPELEIKDLKALSTSFKQQYSDVSNRLETQEQRTGELSDNQVLIHNDLSSFSERLDAIETGESGTKAVEALRKQMYLGLAIVGILGMML